MSIRKVSALLLALATLLIAASAEAVDYKTKLTLKIAASATYDEAYELTVPGETAITTSGWNSLGNITAKYNGSNSGFDSSKKLVVMLSSTNTFTLKASGVSDTISYFVATSENDSAATTKFEFTADEINAKDTNDAFVGTSKPIGVSVEDYSSKSAGDYEDEITYEVSVESAGVSLNSGNNVTVAFSIGSSSYTVSGTFNGTTFTDVTSDTGLTMTWDADNEMITVASASDSSDMYMVFLMNGLTYSYYKEGTTLSSISIGGSDVTSSFSTKK